MYNYNFLLWRPHEHSFIAHLANYVVLYICVRLEEYAITVSTQPPTVVSCKHSPTPIIHSPHLTHHSHTTRTSNPLSKSTSSSIYLKIQCPYFYISSRTRLFYHHYSYPLPHHSQHNTPHKTFLTTTLLTHPIITTTPLWATLLTITLPIKHFSHRCTRLRCPGLDCPPAC